jgi:hypothetical protein
MALIVQVVATPGNLDGNWDKLAACYFQRKEFLAHLHQYNACNQRYYELFDEEEIVAGAVAYTLKINLFTYSRLKANVNMQVIGLPVSVAAPSVIGDPAHCIILINKILENEKGIILGLNLSPGFKIDKALALMTLPTVVFKNKFTDFEDYMRALRHPYRRRIRLIREKAREVHDVVSKCSDFTENHYQLYLEIMKRTKTKLEVLSYDLFRNLPGNFVLLSHYHNNTLLSWNTVCFDDEVLFFFFGGMDYEKRNKFQSYNNNLLSILKTGIEHKFSRIDFGQTAEVAKMRLGGELDLRAMFVYHHNPLILFFFRLIKRWLTYSGKHPGAKVFKDNLI